MAQPTQPTKDLLAALDGRSSVLRDAILQILGADNAGSFAAAERAVHEAARDESDALVAMAVQARVSDQRLQEEARAAVHEQAHDAGAQMRSKGTKSTPVRLLGGSVVVVTALFMLPATPRDPAERKKRGERGEGGAGVYPALAQLGVTDKATPALREAVAHQVASSRSVDAAREALERQGIRVDHKAALRLTYSFAEDAIEARDKAIAGVMSVDVGKEDDPNAQAFGRRLIVSMDGGRVRLKENKPDAVDGDRSFNPQWREPKVMIIYAIDGHGMKDPEFSSIIDVTMGDADQVAALLVGHLRLIGARSASHVRLIADGGSWIWSRGDEIRRAAGILPERWSEQLDLPHLIEYLGRAIEPLTADQIDRKGWLEIQKAALVKGSFEEVVANLRGITEAHELETETAIAFLTAHQSRVNFIYCRQDGQPLGSGAVESAVRRVVNLRVKGNSIYWLREHAQAVMHLRAQALSGRWSELVQRTLASPAWRPRRVP